MAFAQVTSSVLPLEKVEIGEEWEEPGVCKAQPVSRGSAWCFNSDLVSWSRGLTPLSATATRLDSIKSLCKEGAYWATHNKWKRTYTTRIGVDIQLVEDVPEAGGQNCIWAAGLVMARYIEHPTIAPLFHRKRILELGAGAGLTSMVAAMLGGQVLSTEQDSCLGYLRYNIKLNPHILGVTERSLHWMVDYEGEQFDVILGCDITYDIKMIDAIFDTLSRCLRPSGTCLICHDNESCPLSREAQAKMGKVAESHNFLFDEILYEGLVEPSYFNSNVKMWKIRSSTLASAIV